LAEDERRAKVPRRTSISGAWEKWGQDKTAQPSCTGGARGRSSGGDLPVKIKKAGPARQRKKTGAQVIIVIGGRGAAKHENLRKRAGGPGGGRLRASEKSKKPPSDNAAPRLVSAKKPAWTSQEANKTYSQIKKRGLSDRSSRKDPEREKTKTTGTPNRLASV